MSELVALTGATGFIGNAILSSLSRSGIQIQALTRSPRTDTGQIKWIIGDLQSSDSLAKLVEGADTIIHCAGVVRGKSLDEFLAVNQSGIENLLTACHVSPEPKRLLLISSLAARHPDLSWYALSKNLAEQTLRTQAKNIHWSVFRPTAVYGPGDREIRPLLQAMKFGVLPTPNTESQFSLLHIDDLVSAVIAWRSAPIESGGVYELDDGTANGYNWQTLIELANQVWGKSVIRIPIPLAVLTLFSIINLGMARLFHYSPMLTPGKVREIAHPEWICDNSAISKQLGWRPRIQLLDAMNEPSLLQL